VTSRTVCVSCRISVVSRSAYLQLGLRYLWPMESENGTSTLGARFPRVKNTRLESSGPRAVLKRAFVMRLIPDQDEGDVWLQMLDDRNLTSHAYDETLAARICTRIVHDYAARLAQLVEKIQTLRWD
jgi:nucleotidyltransferase-like protein